MASSVRNLKRAETHTWHTCETHTCEHHLRNHLRNLLNSAPDDAIVVVEVEKGSWSMDTSVRALREKLGNEAMAGLQAFVDDAGRQWKDDVLTIAGERFERRLGHEIGAFRVEVAKEFAAMRVEAAKEFAAIRVELAATRVSLLKWSFLFWIGQFAAVSGMMAFLLRTIGPR